MPYSVGPSRFHDHQPTDPNFPCADCSGTLVDFWQYQPEYLLLHDAPGVVYASVSVRALMAGYLQGIASHAA